MNAPSGGQSVAFDDRNWAARWYAFRVLKQFAGTGWDTVALNDALADTLIDLKNTPTGGTKTFQELEIIELVNAARDERASALGEILAQDVEFITAFMEALSMTPGSHPRTYRVLHIASLIGSYCALYYKDIFERPRPSWECPALMPPVPVPGHASYPSGHATQAYLFWLTIKYMLGIVSPALPAADITAVGETLSALAHRVARNREIAGLHYPSDSKAGKDLAEAIFAVLSDHTGSGQSAGDYTLRKFGAAVVQAASEWKPG
jgi:membrane-associated phospholipid phosphatase